MVSRDPPASSSLLLGLLANAYDVMVDVVIAIGIWLVSGLLAQYWGDPEVETEPSVAADPLPPRSDSFRRAAPDGVDP